MTTPLTPRRSATPARPQRPLPLSLSLSLSLSLTPLLTLMVCCSAPVTVEEGGEGDPNAPVAGVGARAPVGGASVGGAQGTAPSCQEDPSSPDYPANGCPPPPPPTGGVGGAGETAGVTGEGGGASAPGGECAEVTLRGIACAPSGESIVGARVEVRVTDCHGVSQTLTGETDAMGRYTIHDVPIGEGTLTITAGSFNHSEPIDFSSSNNTSNYERTCIGATSAKIAVVTGQYDSIEHIIDRLGFEYDALCGDLFTYGARQLLDTPAALSTYDVLFINCGALLDFTGSADGARMAQNLRSYVEAGGSVYASDLSAGLIAEAYPDLIDFEMRYDSSAVRTSEICCTCGNNCPAYCQAQGQAEADSTFGVCVGLIPGEDHECFANYPYYGAGMTGEVRATVRNANLSAALGHSDLTVSFDLDSWVRVTRVSPGVEVLVEAESPLMVRYTSSAGGRLIYTSFHNEAQPSADLEKILRALIFEL
jgi:hypothetical protein